jgi:hypothetical protein
MTVITTSADGGPSSITPASEAPGAPEPGSPGAWAAHLARVLTEQHRRVTRFAEYYAGRHRISFASRNWREHYGGIFQNFSINYTGLVPDAIAERLQVDGFRIGKEPQADEAANEIWQRNGMDGVSDTGHVESLVNGLGAVLVWPDAEDESKATMTLEHASEVVIALDPNNRRRRLAALKIYRDPWGFDQYQLWMPDIFARFAKGPDDTIARQLSADQNPFGVVPMAPLIPQPTSIGWPISEVERVIPLQDAINKLFADVIVISEALALPLRYILGWIEETQADAPGESQIIKAAKSAKELLEGSLLTIDDPDAKIGQLPGAELTGHIGMIRELVQNVATLSRIPFHYIAMNGGQVPSGEAIQSAEAGLISIVKRRQRQLGIGWEEAMALAFLIEGDSTRARETRTEAVWANPGTQSMAVLVDAAVKKGSAPILVPQRQLYEDLGYSPQQIARFDALRALDELTMAMTQIQTPAVGPGAEPGQPAQPQPASAVA